MTDMRRSIEALIIILLFFGTIAGTIVTYNDALDQKNLEITSLKSKIADFASQNSDLKAQEVNLSDQVARLTELEYAKLQCSLGVTEINDKNGGGMVEYSRLFIQGSVFNVGNVTAYNAGLRVVAYAENGSLEINMTVPLDNGGDFGTDGKTEAYVLSQEQFWGTQTSLQLGFVSGLSIIPVSLNIYHEGDAVNWAICTVWSNN